MQAVIFADRLGYELEPLTGRTCVALLPVAAKPVLVHTLEALAGAGIHEAVLVVSAYAEQVKRTLGTGSRWGVRLDYLLSAGEEPPAACLPRLTGRLGREFLALRGDVLRSRMIRPFLERANTVAGSTVHALIDGAPAALCLCRPGLHDLEPLLWATLFCRRPADTAAVVALDNAALSRLESLAAYQQANLDAAAGGFAGLSLPGRLAALGLLVGPHSRASPKSLKQGIAYIGAGCRVHPNAELAGNVVISDRVFIDRYATLRTCLVLPDAYIGELVELHNAIVRGNDLIRVDTGAVLPLIETFLPADLRPATLVERQAERLNRLLGLLLLIGSLPLWPLALLAALLNNPERPLRLVRLRSPGAPVREFSAWEWATPSPVLRHLPRLLAVVAGHLRMVGTLPLTPEQADRRQGWERLGDEAPAGLIGPALLDLPKDAAEETRRLSDAFYARQRTTGKDLRYLGKGLAALFTRRAWRP